MPEIACSTELHSSWWYAVHCGMWHLSTNFSVHLHILVPSSRCFKLTIILPNPCHHGDWIGANPSLHGVTLPTESWWQCIMHHVYLQCRCLPWQLAHPVTPCKSMNHDSIIVQHAHCTVFAGTRWLGYYLAHNSQGPTKGIWWEHVAPASAFTVLHIDPLPGIAMPLSNTTSWVHAPAHVTWLGAPAEAGSATSSSSSTASKAGFSSCPFMLFSQYIQSVQLALPVDPLPDLECACKHLLLPILQQQQQPTLPVLSAEHLHGSVRDMHGRAVPDASPVVALAYSKRTEVMSGPLRVIQQSHAALQWLEGKEGRSAFPSLFDGTMA